MKTLTHDEFRRVHETLYRRLPKSAVNDIRAIGFGPAIRNGQYDASRPIAACIYVDRKRRKVSGDRKIKPQIAVRVKRGRHYEETVVPTDVRELPQLVPSGKFVSTLSDVWLGSAGVLIAWKFTGPTWNWGVVTGSHFTQSLALGDIAVLQTVQHIGPNIPAILLTRSTAVESVDSSLFRVQVSDLILHGLVNQTNPPLAGSVWSETNLSDRLLQSRSGQSLWAFPGTNRFQTGTYFPQSGRLVPPLGNLKNVFLVSGEGSISDPFREGTSGTAWQVEGKAAAIQVAHDPKHLQTGLAQFLDTQLIWAKKKIQRLFASTLTDLRFVRAL
jgi:hypothetical protein